MLQMLHPAPIFRLSSKLIYIYYQFFRPKKYYSPNFFVSLQAVRGEIRTNKEALAIISR